MSITEAAPDVALEAIGVSRTFGGVKAVQDVDFRAYRGEVHALLGENGAGKSTLVKLLAGALEPSSGTVALANGMAPKLARAGRESSRVGIVFQELSLIPDMTVADNVWFSREPLRRLRTVRTGRLRTATNELFDRLGIADINPSAYVRDLSLTQRQVVEIAKVLSEPHEIVVLDEATSALSPVEGEWLLRQARMLADAGIAVVFISHRFAEIERTADRISVLRNGRKVAECLRGEKTSSELVTLMLNRSVERLFPPRTTKRGDRVALSVRGLRAGSRLQGVDLDLREGEIVGLGGLQGQGQGELLRSLCGVIRATGKIEVFGRPLHSTSPRAALRGSVGVVLVPEDRQREGLLLEHSVRENLTLSSLRWISRGGLIDRRREHEAASESMRELNIVAADAEQKVSALSGGNQQKVVFGKVLLSRARILLLHDPTRGIDVGTKAQIYALLRSLVGDGYSLLLYSTESMELLNVADRIAVMFDGRISVVLEGTSMSEEALIAASLGTAQ